MAYQICTNCNKKFWDPNPMKDGVLYGGRIVCSNACSLGNSMGDIGDGVGEIGGVVKNVGMSALGEGAGVAASAAGEIGGAAAAGVAMVTQQAGLKAGATIGAAFVFGPGLTAVIAFLAGEVWAIWLGMAIFQGDWIFGIMYFLATGFGLIIATIVAMGAIFPVIWAAGNVDEVDTEGLSQREIIQLRVKKSSGKMMVVAGIMDVVMGIMLLVGLGLIGFL